jgi:hypothetical protein
MAVRRFFALKFNGILIAPRFQRKFRIPRGKRQTQWSVVKRQRTVLGIVLREVRRKQSVP